MFEGECASKWGRELWRQAISYPELINDCCAPNTILCKCVVNMTDIVEGSTKEETVVLTTVSISIILNYSAPYSRMIFMIRIHLNILNMRNYLLTNIICLIGTLVSNKNLYKLSNDSTAHPDMSRR